MSSDAATDTDPGGDLDAGPIAAWAEALTTAVQGLVREHWNVIPGVDLRQVLGVPAGGRT